MTKRFIIFSLARSGTSWLVTSLRSHPDILCHGEALYPRHIPRQLFGSARDLLTAEMCEQDPVSYAYKLFEHSDGAAAVGFKVFPVHSPSAHRALLEDETISKIVLTRENTLATWSSLLVARLTGRWNTRNKGIQQEVKAGFDAEAFETFCKRGPRFYDKIDRLLAGPRLDITYAKDVMEQRSEPILEFLGVSAEHELSCIKQKMLGRSIVDRFEEPDMVRAYLDKIGKPEWAYE
jgi:LPS sulfotransferase NodH